MSSGRHYNIQELISLFYEDLYRYAYRSIGCSSDAEDLTQDTYCKAHAKIGQLRDHSLAKSWLFGIMTNLIRKRYNDNKRLRIVSISEDYDPAQTESEKTDDADLDALQKALNQLPDVYRLPIILYFFGKFSYREIAEQMEMPIGTVMSRLNRAKVLLKELLTQAGGRE